MQSSPHVLTEEQMLDLLELAGWEVNVSRGILKEKNTWFATVNKSYDCITTWGNTKNEAIRNAFDNFIKINDANNSD